MKVSRRFIAYYFLFIAIVLLGVAGFFYNKARYFSLNSLETKGEVVNIREDVSVDQHSNATFYYHPLVEFTTAEGEEIVFESSSTLDFQEYKAGKIVEVLYLPDDPKNARIKDVGSPWLLPGILAAVGLVDLMTAFGFLIYLRSKEKGPVPPNNSYY